MKEPFSKKDQLILNWGDDEVHTSRWFDKYNITNQSVSQFLSKQLLRRLGGGAYVKGKDKLNWQAAISTAQNELNLPIHVGGHSALNLLGLNHYLNFKEKPPIYVIARERIRTPIWLKQNDWGVEFQFKTSKLFRNNHRSTTKSATNSVVGLEVFKNSKFKIKISSRERAIMELIDNLDLSESFDTLEKSFEGLTNIRSDLTQKLLETCNSIKVKRVFLFMATRLELPVIKKLKLNKINLGSGKRVIVKNGQLDKKFSITIPYQPHRNG